MVCYENDCVDCGFPCFDSCPYKRVPHYYCDECGFEDQLYFYDGEELCHDCIMERLEKVN